MFPFDPALPFDLRSCAGIGTPCGGPYELSARGAIAKASLDKICQRYGRPETRLDVDFIVNHVESLELSLTFRYALLP